MKRIIDPLQGWARRCGRGAEHLAPPVVVHGGPLSGIDYLLPVASAQLKSAILLAGIYASSPTTIREPHPSRDHTERMLRAQGARSRR